MARKPRVADPNGAVTTLVYNDPLDRLTSVTDPAGTTSYTYDATPNQNRVTTAEPELVRDE